MLIDSSLVRIDELKRSLSSLVEQAAAGARILTKHRRPIATLSAADMEHVDTSAYLCLLLGEAGWPVAGELDSGHLLSSAPLVLETERTLIHLSRAGTETPAALQNAIDRLARDLEHSALRDLTLDICRRWRVVPVVSTLRSLDLAHLRTALWFHQRQPLTRFVSLDVPQNQAARELGLPV